MHFWREFLFALLCLIHKRVPILVVTNWKIGVEVPDLKSYANITGFFMNSAIVFVKNCATLLYKKNLRVSSRASTPGASLLPPPAVVGEEARPLKRVAMAAKLDNQKQSVLGESTSLHFTGRVCTVFCSNPIPLKGKVFINSPSYISPG
jgi:hypothetical protein